MKKETRDEINSLWSRIKKLEDAIEFSVLLPSTNPYSNQSHYAHPLNLRDVVEALTQELGLEVGLNLLKQTGITFTKKT